MDDFTKRFSRLEEQVRTLELRLKNHTETKTFLVPAAVSAGDYVPPFWAGVDTDGGHPETKRIHVFRGVLRGGTCTVAWLINGTQIGDDHVITTIANEFELLIDPDDYPMAFLTDGDTIRPSFVTADGAEDFSGSVYMLTEAA